MKEGDTKPAPIDWAARKERARAFLATPLKPSKGGAREVWSDRVYEYEEDTSDERAEDQA